MLWRTVFCSIIKAVPRLINTYIFKEITVPFALSVAILTFTALLSKVIKLVDLMVTHGLGPLFVLKFVASVLPAFLIYTIPISFLIAVLVAFTRLSSDCEITAMKASGVSLYAMMKPVLFMAALSFILTLSFTLYLFPLGNITMKKLVFDAARSRIASGMEEKTFYDRFKGIVLYVDHLSGARGGSKDLMEGIFIFDNSNPGEPNIFAAKEGAFLAGDGDNSLYLKLYDGSLHRKNDKNDSYSIADFSTYLLDMSISGADASMLTKSHREMYPGELIGKVRETRASGENPAPHMIDLHKRFSLPASIFVFALLGLPLGIQKARTARFTGFSISLGVVLAYYVTSTALETLGNNGALNPVLAVWGSDVIFAIIGLYLFYMAANDRPIAFISG